MANFSSLTARLVPSRPGGADPGQRQAAFFVRRLQLLMSASVGLIKALETLERQEEDPQTSLAISNANRRLERGMPLSAALAGTPRLISRQCEEIVKMAEANGQLEVALRQMADSLEQGADLSQRFRSALIVPVFQMVGSVLLLFLLVMFLLPGLLEMAGGLQADIGPLPRAAFAVASLALDPLVMVAELQVAVALALGFRRWWSTPSGRRSVDQLLLRTPLLGRLMLDSAAFRFTQGMGLLLNSGSSPMSALKSVAETLDNVVLREQLTEVGDRVFAGDSLAQALRVSTTLDPLLISVVEVGEETGRLPSLLQSMAPFYQERIGDRLEAALAVFEPLMLAAVGLVVGVLSLMFFHPLMRIVEKL
jgi:type IV pilus assembly protein PilC